MMEQDWWQRKLQRPRPVQPQRLPPLNPTNAQMPIMQDAGFTPRQPDMPEIETLGGLQQPDTSPYPPAPALAEQGRSSVEAPAGLLPPTQPEQMPPPLDPQGMDYAQLMSPPKKEKLWKDILYVAGQAAANIFDTEGNYQPIERLGETKKRKKDAQAMQRIQVRNAKQKTEQDAAYSKARTDTIYADDARQAGELQRKTDKDKAQIEYWGRKADQGDLKLANDEKLIELRDKWAESKDVNDKRRLELVEKEMQNRMKRDEKNRVSRERIAASQQQFTAGQDAKKMQFRVAMKNLERAIGTEKAIQKITDQFKMEYRKVNGRNATQAEIEAFLTNAQSEDIIEQP